jgi:hypothetical protein
MAAQETPRGLADLYYIRFLLIRYISVTGIGSCRLQLQRRLYLSTNKNGRPKAPADRYLTK